jgi:hypothetical protein
MSRGAPPPTVVWKTTEQIRVGAGEMVVHRRRLPRGLSWRISKSHEPPKNTNKWGLPASMTAYDSAIATMQPAELGEAASG